MGSLKEKQTEALKAIVLHQDTFICGCHAEDYSPQYCRYGCYRPLLGSGLLHAAQAMAVVDIFVGLTTASGAALVLIVFFTLTLTFASPDPFPRFSSTH